ncbi:holin, partial [Nocardia asteroides]|uniref:holin n=1 Tax=Nocardia asteroides TaxID=1824 RepID=UPI0036596DAE
MTTPAFWRATIERALRTAAQTLIAVLALDSTGLTDVDWGPGLALAGSAALLAVEGQALDAVGVDDVRGALERHADEADL